MHLGCGPKYLPGFLNVDANPFAKTDLWLDVRNGLPFASQSVESIYATHMFEHFFDDELRRLMDDFVQASRLAAAAGFEFVDLKCCHGYLGHEFLSAYDRPGPYGGPFENRTRFLREIVSGIRAEVPGLGIGVRFSAFDFVPFRPGPDGTGEPEAYAGARYNYAFGGDGTGTITVTAVTTIRSIRHLYSICPPSRPIAASWWKKPYRP